MDCRVYRHGPHDTPHSLNNHQQHPIGGDMDYIHWIDLLIGLGAAGAFVLVLAMTDRIGGRK